MEDIKAYIESGILELYVLGDVSPAEKLQVEDMASKHPAIKAELEEIERSMELYAEENAVEPADHLRDRILNSLVINLADDNNFPTKKAPVKDKVIQLKAPQQGAFYKYAFAACLALLIVSVAALISVSSQLHDANTQLVAMNSQNQHFTNAVKFMDQQLDVYRDPAFKVIKLHGMPKHTSSTMLVAFNPVKKKVMIDMTDMQLPANDSTHQYQLWAMVAGKPVNLGVFDKTDSDSVDMKEMRSVESPRAFCVTLEPRGGSINPTLTQMVVSNL